MLMMGFRTHYPQNMMPWHTENFELKEFKERLVQEGLSELSLKQIDQGASIFTI